jgi:hypothetical protein
MIEVKKIKNNEAVPMILKIHYARRVPSIQFAFGLFIDNIMFGVVTYGQPASPSLCVGIAGVENKKKVLLSIQLFVLLDPRIEITIKFLEVSFPIYPIHAVSYFFTNFFTHAVLAYFKKFIKPVNNNCFDF